MLFFKRRGGQAISRSRSLLPSPHFLLLFSLIVGSLAVEGVAGQLRQLVRLLPSFLLLLVLLETTAVPPSLEFK
jgi:hypothetical protein